MAGQRFAEALGATREYVVSADEHRGGDDPSGHGILRSAQGTPFPG
jgi:hypothetical protein